MPKPILSVPHDKRTTTRIAGDLKGHYGLPTGNDITPDQGQSAQSYPWKRDVDWWFQGGDITSSEGALWKGDNGSKHWQISEFGHQQGIYPSTHVTGYYFQVQSNSQKNRKIFLHRTGLILTKPNNNDIFWSSNFLSLDDDVVGTITVNQPNDFTQTNNGYYRTSTDSKTVYQYLKNGWVISKLRLYFSTDNGTSGSGVNSELRVKNFRWAYNTIDGKNLVLPKLRPYDSRFDQKRIG